MKAWRKGSRRSDGDRAEAEELPIWAPRSRGRWGRKILAGVGIPLVVLGPAMLLTPEDPGDGHTCGDATAVAWVRGADTAAPGRQRGVPGICLGICRDRDADVLAGCSRAVAAVARAWRRGRPCRSATWIAER